MSTLQSGVIRVIACVAGGIGGGAREPREVWEHVKSKPFLQLSLRKQPTFRNATTGFPAKWRLWNERRNSILMTRNYPDLGGAPDSVSYTHLTLPTSDLV